MGATMHQTEAGNFIVTIAVVDRYGELITHKDFARLLPPKVKKQTKEPEFDSILNEYLKTNEQLEHEQDRDQISSIL